MVLRNLDPNFSSTVEDTCTLVCMLCSTQYPRVLQLRFCSVPQSRQSGIESRDKKGLRLAKSSTKTTA